ncbi:ATP-dependent zinc metalloprotease FtsH 2 [Caulifigura coniformis]|uniref:ATP-dependent zinc metalloprotease FtsH 2 n=1 Tax=Caulifigura coniformis TaxID=2527983 RepID=A0A517SIP5_9PLAN|nr:ATP-binding protein [Caulifigura coniformis]QDT56014.1 ATP-dependent zinc metalloprotease FtsH 2 [Caulifigura coniformis]
MPTTRELTELFRAIAENDNQQASAIASRICRSEETKGHRSLARTLRGALAAGELKGPFPSPQPSEPFSNGSALLSTALLRLDSGCPISSITLEPTLRDELETIIGEWSGRDKLQRYGLQPRSKLLFYGPPGCGKSMTARAIATELAMPVYMARFDALIGAYLGQTAIHLRQIFDFVERTPCVLLLDELDALGKQRGNPLDVGELDRIVIALMQELEHSRPLGLIIATSNLASHLDAALWRRFDLALHFNAPTKERLDSFLKDRAAQLGVQLSRPDLRQALKAKSFSEAEAALLVAVRRHILGGS